MEPLFYEGISNILYGFMVVVKRIPKHKGRNIVDKIGSSGVVNGIGFQLAG
jgi:hypothetical protein